MSPLIRFQLFAPFLLALLSLTSSAQDPPSGDTRPVDTVEIEVAYHLRSGLGVASALAGTTVAIGIGAATDDPLHLDRPVLSRITSDDEGVARTILQLPRAMTLLKDARIWARVEADGFVQAVCRLPMANRSGVKPVVLRARPGRFFRARVLTPGGQPVAGARVWLIDGENEKVPEGLSDEQGYALVRYEKAGTYFLHVRSAHPGQPQGTATAGPFEVDLKTSHEPVEVEIQVYAPLSGRIVDPAGEPVRGAHLLALPRGRTAFPEPGLCMEAERKGTGLLGGHARTDGDGRFELPRLLDGDYDLYGALSWAWDKQYSAKENRADGFHTKPFFVGPDPYSHRSMKSVKIGTRGVDATTSRLELVLPVRRIEVRVTAASGSPVDPYQRSEEGEREESKLEITAPDDPYWYPPTFPVEIDDLLVLHVASADDHLVSWNALDTPYIEERIATAPWHTRLNLTLGPRSRPAQLAIHVFDRAGEPSSSLQRTATSSTRRWRPVTGPTAWSTIRNGRVRFHRGGLSCARQPSLSGVAWSPILCPARRTFPENGRSNSTRTKRLRSSSGSPRPGTSTWSLPLLPLDSSPVRTPSLTMRMALASATPRASAPV